MEFTRAGKNLYINEPRREETPLSVFIKQTYCQKMVPEISTGHSLRVGS
jgi:hypothetical protein